MTGLRRTLFNQAFWWLPLLLGILLPVMIYGVMPQLGVATLAEMLTLKKIILLGILAVGGFVYVYYLRFVSQQPHWLVFFILVGWAIVYYLNALLMEVGINVRIRPLLILALGFPALGLMWRYRVPLWQQAPHFKWYLLFFGWLVLYFFIYNSNAQDPRFMTNGSLISGGSVGVLQATSYFYCLCSLILAGVSMLIHPHPTKYFDGLNKAVLIVSSLIALYTIIGYPALLTSLWLDGFQRAVGIYTHPNPFAHHMGLIMVYLMGLFIYYQDTNKSRLPGGLLTVAIVLNLLAFLLGMSKTAIGVCVLSGGLLFLMNLSSPVVRKHFLKVVISLAVLIPLGLVLYQAVTEVSFMEILERRMDAKDSMNWRTETWAYLLAKMHGMWLLVGHGFTDANAWVFQLTYNNKTNAKPLMMVHNGYIALLYDFGVMGLSMFVAVLVQAWHAGRRMMQPALAEFRPLLSTIVALSLYFMMTCGFDEMTYMFDAPIIFWTLTTTMFCLVARTLTSVPVVPSHPPAAVTQKPVQPTVSGGV